MLLLKGGRRPLWRWRTCRPSLESRSWSRTWATTPTPRKKLLMRAKVGLGSVGRSLRSIYTIRQIVLYDTSFTDRINPIFVARHFQILFNHNFHEYLLGSVGRALRSYRLCLQYNFHIQDQSYLNTMTLSESIWHNFHIYLGSILF
jgi:hypothetical protein